MSNVQVCYGEIRSQDDTEFNNTIRLKCQTDLRALENLDDDVEINRPWENIKPNLN
jgi:hypothetical protein